jgi:hypothetical protein
MLNPRITQMIQPRRFCKAWRSRPSLELRVPALEIQSRALQRRSVLRSWKRSLLRRFPLQSAKKGILTHVIACLRIVRVAIHNSHDGFNFAIFEPTEHPGKVTLVDAPSRVQFHEYEKRKRYDA